MALRFRKSIKLAPGVRLNLSGSGASVSLGPRGASVNFGKRGTYLNAGIPGTGISSRTRIDASKAGATSRTPSSQPSTSLMVTVTVQDDGTVSFLDSSGNPLDASIANKAKRQHGDAIRAQIAEVADQINEEIDNLTRIHRHTPAPHDIPTYAPAPYPEPAPEPPAPKPIRLFARLLGKRAAIEAQNSASATRHLAELTEWQQRKRAHDLRELEKAAEFDANLRGDTALMETQIESSLSSIHWPRETLVAFELTSTHHLRIDVDMPEIEDLPSKTASIPERGYKLVLRPIKGKALQDLYTRHILSVGFRILGEAFAVLPSVATVVLSAFTQRTESGTGHVADVYVYSVRVKRADWERINFSNLAALDLVEAFSKFELRMKFNRGGVLEQIDAFAD